MAIQVTFHKDFGGSFLAGELLLHKTRLRNKTSPKKRLGTMD
jgi:hypothetical protein